jgi:4-hydroxy-2-oxoheptanedioate aldolase
MGHPGAPSAPPVAQAIERTLTTIRAAGKAPGMPATAETLERVVGSGCRYVYNHLPRILGAGAKGFLAKAGRS